MLCKWRAKMTYTKGMFPQQQRLQLFIHLIFLHWLFIFHSFPCNHKVFWEETWISNGWTSVSHMMWSRHAYAMLVFQQSHVWRGSCVCNCSALITGSFCPHNPWAVAGLAFLTNQMLPEDERDCFTAPNEHTASLVSSTKSLLGVVSLCWVTDSQRKQGTS